MKVFAALIGFVAIVIAVLLVLESDEDVQRSPTDDSIVVSPPEPSIGMVDDARILAALENEPGSWLAHGIDFNSSWGCGGARRPSSLPVARRS